MRRSTAWLGLVATAATIPFTAIGQRTVTRSVFISAVEDSGMPLPDLTRADVQVTEDGVKREVTRVTLCDEPLRIALLADSSTATSAIINTVRTALHAFVDNLPDEHEVAFVSTGGQTRVRTRPEDGKDKLRAEIARFASEGGANAFLDTMIEVDRRFLKTAPTQWPVFVILTADNGDAQFEPDLRRYNAFMNDFVARGGAAHAVIVTGTRTGPITELITNLTENVQGLLVLVNSESSLPARMTAIADRLTADHDRMRTRYEVAFNGDARITQPIVNVVSNREGVRLQMSARRPF
jgi:hypothetical protein